MHCVLTTAVHLSHSSSCPLAGRHSEPSVWVRVWDHVWGGGVSSRRGAGSSRRVPNSQPQLRPRHSGGLLPGRWLPLCLLHVGAPGKHQGRGRWVCASVWFNVPACFPVACVLELWGMCGCLLSGVNLLGEMVRQPVEEGLLCHPVTAYPDNSELMHNYSRALTHCSSIQWLRAFLFCIVFFLLYTLLHYDLTFSPEPAPPQHFLGGCTLVWRSRLVGHVLVHALCCLSFLSCLCSSSVPPPFPVWSQVSQVQ